MIFHPIDIGIGTFLKQNYPNYVSKEKIDNYVLAEGYPAAPSEIDYKTLVQKSVIEINANGEYKITDLGLKYF